MCRKYIFDIFLDSPIHRISHYSLCSRRDGSQEERFRGRAARMCGE